MKSDSFENDCEAICDKLIAHARKMRPNWNLHPDEKKLVSSKRYELNKRIKDDDGSTLVCQYEFTRDGIAVALYLTMLGSRKESACDALQNAKSNIEQQLVARSTWKMVKGKRVRFSVSAMPLGQDDVPELVELMWRFQEATFPLIGF